MSSVAGSQHDVSPSVDLPNLSGSLAVGLFVCLGTAWEVMTRLSRGLANVCVCVQRQHFVTPDLFPPASHLQAFVDETPSAFPTCMGAFTSLVWSVVVLGKAKRDALEGRRVMRLRRL